MAESSSKSRSCISSTTTSTLTPKSVADAAKSKGKLGKVDFQGATVGSASTGVNLMPSETAPLGSVFNENALKVPRAARSRSPTPHEPCASRSDWLSERATFRRNGEGAISDSARASYLSHDPPPPTSAAGQVIQQHGLAHTAKPRENDALIRSADRGALAQHLEVGDLVIVSRQLGRPESGPGRVGVVDGVHM